MADKPQFEYRICENCLTRCESSFCLQNDYCAQIHHFGGFTAPAEQIIAVDLQNKRLTELRKRERQAAARGISSGRREHD